MATVKRTGLTSLRNLALALCRAVGTFSPAIKAFYPNSTALHVALDSANTACAVLVQEANNTLPEGD